MEKRANFFTYFCLLSICTLVAAQAAAKPFILAYDRTFASPDIYKKQAQDRFDRHLATAPQSDLSLILNLFYTAWARSQANLITQDRLEKIHAALSDATHTFTLARLSPGLYVQKQTKAADQKPENVDAGVITITQALAYHKDIGSTYHRTLDYIFDQHKLTSRTALAGLTLIRRDARTAVSQALATVARHLDTVIEQAHAQLSTAVENFSHQKLLGMTRSDKHRVSDEPRTSEHREMSDERGAIDVLWQYIRRFFARAFFASDKAYSHGSYAVDQALLMSQSVHNALWRVMEEVRSAFYAAHYAAVYAALQKSAAAPQAYCVLFDANGTISTCPKILPEPHSLSAPFVLS